mmetsp:Transcript_9342/g.30083  ORF Transcript_9342/g.30083 Transcript_9342/m.30083 type:complete len:259 (+) Transcript_9342:844-1620(+)
MASKEKGSSDRSAASLSAPSAGGQRTRCSRSRRRNRPPRRLPSQRSRRRLSRRRLPIPRRRRRHSPRGRHARCAPPTRMARRARMRSFPSARASCARRSSILASSRPRCMAGCRGSERRPTTRAHCSCPRRCSRTTHLSLSSRAGLRRRVMRRWTLGSLASRTPRQRRWASSCAPFGGSHARAAGPCRALQPPCCAAPLRRRPRLAGRRSNAPLRATIWRRFSSSSRLFSLPSSSRCAASGPGRTGTQAPSLHRWMRM